MTTPLSKNPLKHLRIADVRGAAHLAIQATSGVTRIVEGVHRSVWDTLGIPAGAEPGKTRGITGLVYRTIHDVTKLVGNGVDSGLAGLQHWFDAAEADRPTTPAREALITALNGVLGDYLVASKNPLAIPMTLRYRCEALDWHALPALPEATGKVVILIHGLCMNDIQQHVQHRGHAVEHGAALATLGYTPVYLRYNSGLHISHNGRELAAQLEQLITHWPTPIEELTVVAHSMGGLLIRSAVHYAQQAAVRWLDHLKNIIFLGTPHHGAPLERLGNWVDVLLSSTTYTAPFATPGQIRSAGITDLRYGYVLDEDWQAHDRFQRRPDQRQTVPLPEGVMCYTIAATTAAKRSVLANRLIGDGLVPLHSALGYHDDPQRNLVFDPTAQSIAYRMNHLQLLSSPTITEQLLQWLTAPQA